MCKKICKECPFSIDSIQGYLDYHTTDEILSDMSKELPFTCHLQRKENQHLNLIEMENGKQNVCRGYVATATKTAQLFGSNPFYGKEMLKLQKEITKEDKDKVFNKWSWKKYHDEE